MERRGSLHCMVVLPIPFWIPAFAGMTKRGARVYPGSESRKCFHSNDDFRGTGVVVWYGESARWVLPRPSSAPAGDKSLASRSLRPHYIPPSPPLWIPAFAGMTIGKIDGIPRHYRSRVTSSRIGVRDMLSDQSLMPAGAGTPRYEKLELWLGTANWHRGFCHAPPPPQRATSPSPREVFDRTTFPLPTPLDSGLRRNDELGAGLTSAGTVDCGHARCRVTSFSYQ